MEVCALHGVFAECTKATTSIEHIIPNAIGGRKKTKKCICSECNNKSGHDWDNVLCKQFESISLLFGISRERGSVKPVIISDNRTSEQSVLQPDGKIRLRVPLIDENEVGDETVISVSAPDNDQAKKILKSLVRKRQLEVDWDNLVYREHLIDNSGLNTTLSFDLAGPKVGRAISKMIYLYAVDYGINKANLGRVFDYLSGKTEHQCFGPYYDQDIVEDRPSSKPIHILSVATEFGSSDLTGYVELFGLFRYAFHLGAIESDCSFKTSYVFDPVSGNELTNSVCMNNLTTNIAYYLHPTEDSVQPLQELISEKMLTFSKVWFENNRNHVNEVVVSQIESKLGPISQENYDQAIKELDKIFRENKT